MSAENKRPQKRPAPVALLVACDILLIGVALCVFALFHHVLPRAYVVVGANTGTRAASAAVITVTPAAEPTPGQPATMAPTDGEAVPATASAGVAPPTSAPTAMTTATPKSSPTATATTASAGLGGGKFAARFTDGAVIATAASYRSANANVTLTKMQKNGVTYYVEEIYIRSIENLRTAFAKNTYGRAITDWVLNMAQENDAIAAINGDYYGAGSTGVVIRNGVLYNAKPDGDVCVLFSDGTMEIYQAAEFNAQAAMSAGAYQAWSFGPSLLSADGKALTSFNSRVSGVNPRTAIGYYEPGHYVFVVVDGRQAGYSDGMTLAQLAALFEQLGCQVAYNLDGGQTSSMIFSGKLVNQPTQGGRLTSDIIYIGE
jgi:exopolysaccharide biosynthesis protein